jgi:hypothetical protein
MKNYFVTAMIACILTLSVLVIRQKATAQNNSPEPTDKTGVAIASVSGAAVAKAKNDESSPAIVTKLPDGYRDWRLISVAREEGTLDDIRAVLGNDIAIKAYRDGTRPFPEGTIIARLAWAFLPSEENNKTFGTNQSFVAGPPKNGVQFMIKDSKKYAATGGWGYGQFDDGKAASASMLKSCYACHKAFKDQDFIFTHYAP